MPAPLLALMLLRGLSPQTPTEIVPTDDIWVYPHASDPGHDANLRIWGSEGVAAPADASQAEEISMAYLKWDLSMVPSGRKLTKATLVLTNVPNPGFTLDQAKAAPLQVRPVGTDFAEKTWEYEKIAKLLPAKDDKDVFGSGAPSKLTSDAPVAFEIDLLKGPNDFGKYFNDAVANKVLTLALTSKIDMASLGRSAIYKVYSRDEKDANLRPRLQLKFE